MEPTSTTEAVKVRTVTRILKANWRIIGISGAALLISLLILLLPLASVPVTETVTYQETVFQTVPAAKVSIEKQPYTEMEYREQTIYSEPFVVVPADKYNIIPVYIDMTARENAFISGGYASLDAKNVHFMIFDGYPYQLYPSIFTPRPIYESRRASDTFSLTPAFNMYYFVFECHTYTTQRFFKLNVRLSWQENVVKYRDIPITKTTYEQVPLQVSRQRQVIAYERKSLFQLLMKS